MHFCLFTDGQAQKLNNDLISLHGVTAPKYFWKAICVPDEGSYLFWALNDVGVKKTEAGKETGCGKEQSKKLGIIKCCKKFEDAKNNGVAQNFELPAFDRNKCKTNTAANFLDTDLNNKLQ